MNNKFESPYPPSGISIAEERLYRKQRLAVAYRVFAKNRYDDGLAGHLTVRDPERPDHFWVNPFGMYFGHVRASDLILLNPAGELVEGDSSRVRRMSKAVGHIHSYIYASRPDVTAIAHSHSMYGKIWSTLGRLLDPLTQDFAPLYKDHALHTDFQGPVLSGNEGEHIAKSLGGYRALILQNHGLLSVGKSIDEAAWIYICLERCCKAQLMAESVGKPQLIDDKVMQFTHDKIGDDYGCWLSYQPLYEMIVRSEPDVLD